MTDTIIMGIIVLCSLYFIFLRTTVRIARYNNPGKQKSIKTIYKMYFLSALEGLLLLIAGSTIYFYISSKI